MKPPQFDGKTPWENYRRQFEAAAKANGWNAGERAVALTLALRGEATNILQTLTAQEQEDYDQLIKHLELRYGQAHLEHVYHSQLKNRCQKSGESLQEFETDIARLVRLAYPATPENVMERLAVQAFLDGLRDQETRQALTLARPTHLVDALARALEFEAAKQSCKSQSKVRMIEEDSHEPANLEAAIRKVIKEVLPEKRQIRCWNCGKIGHIQVRLGQFSDLPLPEHRNELNRQLGSYAQQQGPATVYGELPIEIILGSTKVKHQALVADIEDDAIIGMDIMNSRGFELDFKDGVLRVNGEELVLHGRSEELIRVLLAEDVSVPERAETILESRLDGSASSGDVMMFEPKLHDEKIGRGIALGKTLLRAEKFVPVRVMNVNYFPVTLKKGTILGHCSPVSSVIRSVRGTISQPNNLPTELEKLVAISSKDIKPAQQPKLRDLVKKYQDIFDTGQGKGGRTNVVQHKIDTGGARPIRQSARRLPLAKKEEADKIVSDMGKDGVIEPSDSPWSSPVVLVKKKDGSTRFCVDYRQLNNVTKKDSYPLPRIDDTLDTLAGSTIFSTLDLKSGYWQVELAQEDREKTAFTIGSGLWQLMETVLKGLSWNTCLVYLDDIIVVGRSFEDHVTNLKEVILRLRSSGLKKFKTFNCLKGVPRPRCLWEGVAVDDQKIKAVKDWPIPKDIHQLRSFLGLCTYYRRYVLGFANIAKPLTKLTEGQTKFQWSEECQDSFRKLKGALINAPILSYPLPKGKFILDTDASNVGLGAVLSQIQEGQEKVIGYFSKTLSKPERNYCVTRRELLAVVKGVEHFYNSKILRVK
ncbi:hypothetical protein JTB14_032762 [Gonioctena quinquepunctata]|nr:hypothetical protein JTB14_032762 [Gonioctena quinquepunctata]